MKDTRITITYPTGLISPAADLDCILIDCKGKKKKCCKKYKKGKNPCKSCPKH